MPRGDPLGSEFRRFLIAAGASNLGDGIRLGALPLLAISLTDDARLITLVSAATLVPWLVFGPLGGAMVDRHDRRTLLLAGQMGRAALVGLLVALVALDAATIWWVVVVAFGLGVGEIIVDSSSQAAVPQLVEPAQLDRANGQLLSAITVFDGVIGLPLGAVAFSVASSLPFALDVVTFLVGAALVATIRRPLQGERTAVRASVRSDISVGMRFLFGHRLLRGLLGAIVTANLAGNISFGVLVVLVVDELGGNEATFGFVLGVGSVGGVLGSLVAARIVERVGRRIVLTTAPILMVASYAINVVATAAWMAALSFALMSFLVVCANVPGQSLRQSVTPEPLLGRVVASFRTFGQGVAPIGAIVGGFVTQASSVRTANLLAAGVQVVAVVLFVIALRHLGETDRSENGNEPASLRSEG